MHILITLILAAEVAGAAPPSVDARAIEEVAVGKRKVAQASWWGFDPSDATAALQAAINSGAEKVVVENLGRPWIVDKIQLAGNQEVFFEKGVVVLAKRGAFKGKGDSLFTATSKKNVALTGYGATLKMWRQDYDGKDYEKAEWRHVLSIRSCSAVRIWGLTLAESGGDGIYLGVAQKGVTNTDVHIKDVVCDGNYRQGISVISAENLLIENCVLKGTGGTPPMAGIDFEPNHPSEKLSGCVMRNCLSENNRGDGYVLSLKSLHADSAEISMRFEECRSAGNRCGMRVITGNEPKSAVKGQIEATGCRFEGSEQGGIVIGDKPAAGCKLRFVRCQVAGAAPNRPDLTPILFTSGTGNAENLGGVEFVDCTISDPVERLPMRFLDHAGGLRLVDVTGSLFLERGGQRTPRKLDQKQIDAWMPFQAYKRLPRFDTQGAKYEPAFPQAKPAASKSPCRQRGHAEYLLWAEAGDEASLTVRLRVVGRNPAKPASVRIVSPSGKESALARAKEEGDTRYFFRAEETGAYKIICEPDRATVELGSATHRVCLYSEKGGIHFLGTTGELFFWVPAGVREFGVLVNGENAGERVRAGVYDPAGKKVEEKDDIADTHQFLVTRPDPGGAEVWSLRLNRPSHGVLEDFYVRLQVVPPVLAPLREALLRPVAKPK